MLTVEMLDSFQVAKKTAQKSKTILTDFERWQKVEDTSFPSVLPPPSF